MNELATPGREKLQAKKQEVVRQEIWNAAVELFFEEGFDSVTVEQIAQRTGISSRTFFRYFSSKEEVMASMVKSYGNALTQAILNEDSELSGFEVARLATAKVLKPHLPSTQRMHQISSRSPAARMAQFVQIPLLEQELSKAFAARSGRAGHSNLGDRILAGLTLSATGLCAETWVGEQDRSIDAIVEEVFSAMSSVCAKAKPA